MACYDCEDCGLSYERGGKCQRWEYNCPFRHLEACYSEEQTKVDEDIVLVQEINKKLKEIYSIFNKLNYADNYDEEAYKLKNIIDEVEEKVNEELIEEWKEINSK